METQIEIALYPATCRPQAGQWHVPVGEIDKDLKVFGWRFSTIPCIDGWRHATPPDGWSTLPGTPIVFIDGMGRERMQVAITATSSSYIINRYFTIGSRVLPDGRTEAWVASPDNPRCHVEVGQEEEVRKAIHDWLNKHFPHWWLVTSHWAESPTAPR